jgi:hypothetical protein
VRLLLLGLAGEHVPEAQGFVASASDDGAAVGAHGQVKNSVGMASEGGESLHLGVSPDVDLVLGVPVRAHQLVHRLAEHQVAHLRAHVVGVLGRASEGVSNFDGSISSPAAGNQQSVLVGRPGHGLDGSQVIGELDHWLSEMAVPDEQAVVIASGAELLLVERPLESANLLLVSGQFGHEGSAASEVALQDGLVAGASGQQGGTPAHCAHSQRVSRQPASYLHLLHVPDLHLAAVGSQRHQRRLPLAGHGGGDVLNAQVAEFGDL